MRRIASAQSLLQFLALQSSVLAVVQARTCYYTNGEKTDSSFQPCFPDQEESACCAIAKSNEVPNDICLTGGACYVQSSYYRGLLRQGACTDSTWKSGLCPSMNRAASDATPYIKPCPLQGYGFWCASNGTDCCRDAARLDMGEMLNVTVTPLSGSTSASLPSATVSDIPESTASATCSPEANPSESKKTTAVAAGLGAGLGTCLLIALGTIFMQRRIYTKNMRNKDVIIMSQGSAAVQQYEAGPVGSERRRMAFPAELGQEPRVYEVAGNH
ncbi:hypothetical protein P170DRAFT_496483 [Aspergillus steynii IBT 23096]|uniref:Mid2 domain-containing protein n=1 Tax=Aspergillus steynii IBT 23096 TaxID=1392250 RepID=A0A2I2G412_9EURO|nr:uncharacterized protein P170DRAFT_496483 [Aspergillus steynii IBT 23096]PLB47625.1 hypothetical protein P170DRAFT_496483 [Aspergillus steynii IBT 23096]